MDQQYPENRQLQNPETRQSRKSDTKPAESYIGGFDQAHQLHQWNSHIRTGYRLNYHSLRSIFRSMFLLHNQTVNIWTHLIGVIIVLFLLFEGVSYKVEENHALGKTLIQSFWRFRSLTPNTLQSTNLTAPWALNDELQGQQISGGFLKPQGLQVRGELQTWPITVSILGAAICLACSVTYHLVNPLSEKAFKVSLALDYAGIGIYTAFGPIPIFYYSMYCSPTARDLYIGSIGVSGIFHFLCSIVVMRFNLTESEVFKTVKTMLPCWLCFAGMLHCLHDQFVHGNYGDTYSIIPSSYFIMGTLTCYLVGYIFYARRCPERYHPGRYDICGHSHQIWHTFVMLAIIFTYLAALASYEVRNQSPMCPPRTSIL